MNKYFYLGLTMNRFAKELLEKLEDPKVHSKEPIVELYRHYEPLFGEISHLLANEEIRPIINAAEEIKRLREKNAGIFNEPEPLSLDDRCCFEIIECNGKKFHVFPENGDEYPTFRQILKKAVGDFKYGSHNIIAQSWLRGAVYNYGNYEGNKVHLIGTTMGFA